jgi:hypothetical protein
VREHRPESNITNTFDILDRSVELVVDDDAALVVHLDTDSFEVQTLYIWAATHGDKNDVGVKSFLFTASRSLHLESDLSVVGLFRGNDLGVEFELEPLLRE